jgi:long-chain acyl-CoA synthetase
VTRADSALPPEVGPPAALDLRATLAGRRLLVVGATGFLGKVWLALILASFPEVEHLYLLVRPKENLDAPSRLREKVLTSDVFGPLRERHGEGFDRFVESKLTALEGDITAPSLGLSPELRETLRGRIDAVVNVAGIVDFDPPLDEALGVNALGCRELVRVARELGGARILHTSTCFTAGARTGVIEERDPREVPFPRAGKLDTADWDAEREIDECLEDIARVRAATHAELSRPRRRSAERELAELGMERAERWGWPNTYTYTKSLGEQIIAGSGLPNCIVRPAIVESTAVLPFPGWNEGINTSAPIIFLIREGGLQVPGSRNNLDLIPCDMVCAALLLALGELLEGTHRPVYQAAASDLNPCSMERFFELSGLHKRRYYRRTGRGGALLSAVQRRYEGVRPAACGAGGERGERPRAAPRRGSPRRAGHRGGAEPR